MIHIAKIANKKLLALFLLIAAPRLFAGEIALTYDFKTGDKELDVRLNDLNIHAKADMNNFLTEASATFQVEKSVVSLLIERDKMEPAEAYMALRLQELSKKPLETVVETYKKNKGKGWGAIAKELGIKPGSPEFHKLKADRGGMLGGPAKGGRPDHRMTPQERHEQMLKQRQKDRPGGGNAAEKNNGSESDEDEESEKNSENTAAPNAGKKSSEHPRPGSGFRPPPRSR